jgi:uncharacterized membrane protein
MTPQIDPVWPWSLLRDCLAAAPASTVLAVLLAGLVAFALPVLLALRRTAAARNRLLLGGGFVLVGLLTWAAVSHRWETNLQLSGPSGIVLARLEGVALSLLLVGPLALAGVTVWTYLGTPGATTRRIGVVLALRGAAFVLALLAVLRPSLGFSTDDRAGGELLLVVVDTSKSGTIQDESGQSRYEAMLQNLHEAEPALDRLRREQHVQVEFIGFADKTEPFSLDAPPAPDGKRTDIGGMLHHLYDQYSGRRLRAILVQSDGRNNGRGDPFAEALRWARLHCPLDTFLYGNPNTPKGKRDVAVTAVTATPPSVPTKGKLTVRAMIDASGFENSLARVHLLVDGKEVSSAKDVTLKLTTGNQVSLETFAPDKAGEIKVTVTVDPLPGELDPANNSLSTYVTVIKGGINVLLVDKQRAWEPQSICDALVRDPRVQVKTVWVRGEAQREAPLDPNAGKLLDFEQQKYDVIILGDVTADLLRSIRPDALAAIKKQVDEGGAGFLMIGGYASFGEREGHWKGTEIEKLLPLDLSVNGQISQDVQMKPTDDGLRLYSRILRMADGEAAAEKAAWDDLAPLEGANRIEPSKNPDVVVLAESDPGKKDSIPLLITKNYGGGRALAFAGDTTHRWIRDADGKRKHGRFWRQMVLWLAKQDDPESSVWVKPDVRNLAVDADLSFSVGMQSKTGLDVKNGAYEVEVIGPGGERKTATVTREGGEDRGAFRPEAPGEYTLHVKGRGKDAEGADVIGEASARFQVYESDIEMDEWAADDKTMEKLAAVGGGQFQRGSKLAAFLEQLPAPPAPKLKATQNVVPNWNAPTWQPFLVLFFVLFAGLLGAEWVLRRRWGMV